MEKLIKNNKDKFMAELPAGHQERFATKLQTMSQQVTESPSLQESGAVTAKKLWLGILSSVAAILLILILINKQDAIQPYLYIESEKVAEMRMIYETQLNETIYLLENVLENVDDSTRIEIETAIENLTSTSELLAEIAPLPEEKQLAITSQVYKNQIESMNVIYRKINKKERR